jgi:hypothetical protein
LIDKALLSDKRSIEKFRLDGKYFYPQMFCRCVVMRNIDNGEEDRGPLIVANNLNNASTQKKQ